jgi:hypothetical protein
MGLEPKKKSAFGRDQAEPGQMPTGRIVQSRGLPSKALVRQKRSSRVAP